jgi:ABC-type lipoprotein export system ATPase subunit
MVAQLSQNMNFFADMPVADFLKLHAKCRGKNNLDISPVLGLANTLTGEPVHPADNLTTLSGGQTRALMVADVAVISESPIVLIDEIENAGIKKNEALEMLSGTGKIIFVVTHDPVLALSSQKRIVMRNGGMQGIIKGTPQEKSVSEQLNEIDKMVLALREDVRCGKQFETLGFKVSKLQNSCA